ncbi:hypothetical protein VPH35_140171 [Triticum aestivum]
MRLGPALDGAACWARLGVGAAAPVLSVTMAPTVAAWAAPRRVTVVGEARPPVVLRRDFGGPAAGAPRRPHRRHFLVVARADLKLVLVWQLRVDLVVAARGANFVRLDPELRCGRPCSSPGGFGLVVCVVPASVLRQWLDSRGCRIRPGSVGFVSLALLAGGEVCGGFCLVMARWLRRRCAG